MGQELTLVISEHHNAVQRLRKAGKIEEKSNPHTINSFGGLPSSIIDMLKSQLENSHKALDFRTCKNTRINAPNGTRTY